MNMRNINKSLLAIALSSFFAMTASAQGFFVKADYTGSDSADIKGTSAQLQSQTVGLQAGYKFITFEYKHTEYDFSNVENEPFQDLNKIGVRAHYQGNISSNISYLASLGVAALYESDIEFSKSYNITPTLSFGWTFNNGMTAFLGVAANLNDADNEVLPIIGLKIGEDKERGFTGALAYPATFIQYRFNDALAIDATFLTVRDIWHVDEDAKKGRWDDGYCREESYGISLGATWTPMPNLKLSAGVLSYVDREFEAYDKNGHKFKTLEVDNSVGGYARIAVSF